MKRNSPPREISNVILGRVIGNVVSSAKDPSIIGLKLLIVQPIGRDGRAKGRAVVALDSVGAGAGEMVYWCRGKEASLPFLPAEVPTEATIVGIVDEVNLADAAKLAKE
jgi:ethanolamine utilization protein EutN